MLSAPILSSGLNFGEIIALLAVLGSIITSYTTLNVKIASIEARTKNLEIARTESSQQIETIRKENREDHNSTIQKLDDVIDNHKTRNP
jgi:hypothetical protein